MALIVCSQQLQRCAAVSQKWIPERSTCLNGVPHFKLHAHTPPCPTRMHAPPLFTAPFAPCGCTTPCRGIEGDLHCVVTSTGKLASCGGVEGDTRVHHHQRGLLVGGKCIPAHTPRCTAHPAHSHCINPLPPPHISVSTLQLRGCHPPSAAHTRADGTQHQ